MSYRNYLSGEPLNSLKESLLSEGASMVPRLFLNNMIELLSPAKQMLCQQNIYLSIPLQLAQAQRINLNCEKENKQGPRESIHCQSDSSRRCYKTTSQIKGSIGLLTVLNEVQISPQRSISTKPIKVEPDSFLCG